ncbi:DUF1761 domain-containing protein [Evansella sp. LMS18]|jgi:hypothetical protein|uniref:DUF1761 domain-containing protein n=1 Tax=Evansella sp. LMS18 TaxID=2924033 RepID=UPI0020D03527|nr:DUF1761 domain-containing protein [Evansella sp. LMS18]UTR12838.1 DUF1761 domain-containing protein [Evansella sp. LMS18]
MAMIFAVLAGAVIYMVSGMVYYTVLGNRWVDLLNIKNPEQPNYGLLSFVTLLTSLILFGLIRFSGAETFTGGAFAGLLTGLIVSLAYSKDFIFGLGTSTKNALHVFLIAAGYHAIALTLIGGVMALF